MTVDDMIKELSLYPRDWKVTITDGYRAQGYIGKFEILPFEVLNGQMTVDIGIGGCDMDEES